MKCVAPLSAVVFLLAGIAFAADAPKQFAVGEFQFKPPTGWKWVESSSAMRKAQFEVGEGKERAEVVFFYFGPGGAGGTDANVQRWLQQFEEPRDQLKAKVEKSDLGGKEVTLVQAEGTYLSGQPGGPKTAQPGSMLYGAIVESKQGNVFIRLVGPKKVVEAAQPALRRLIEEGTSGGDGRARE